MSEIVSPVTRLPMARQSVPNGGVVASRAIAEVAAGATVFAPAPASEGAFFMVLDSSGAAATSPITVDGNGAQIDAADTYVLSVNGGVVAFVFDAGQWRRADVPRVFDASPETYQRAADLGDGVLPGAETVAAWYIDADTGSDSNAGTSAGAPLQTWAEMMRRIGGRMLRPPVDPTIGGRLVYINILSDLPETDPVNLEFLLGPDVAIKVTGGVEQTYATGTFTAVTPKAPATNTPLQVTDAALAGGWAAHVGRRVRITTAGARFNALAYVAVDLGAGACRLSDASVPNPMDPALGDANWFLWETTSVEPQVGDAYAIERLRTVSIGVVDLRGCGATSEATFPVVVLGELDVRNDTGLLTSMPIEAPGIFMATYSMQVSPYVILGSPLEFYSINDHWRGGCFVSSSTTNAVQKQGGLAGVGHPDPMGIHCTGLLILSHDTMCQGCAIRGHQLTIQSACVFDAPDADYNRGGHAVVVGGQQYHQAQPVYGPAGSCVLARLESNDANVRLWGSGSAGVGVLVGPGSVFQTEDEVPTITGAGGNFRLGDANTARAWDEGAGAYSTARACTWANLAATIAAGGFDYNAHNVALRSSVLGPIVVT